MITGEFNLLCGIHQRATAEFLSGIQTMTKTMAVCFTSCPSRDTDGERSQEQRADLRFLLLVYELLVIAMAWTASSSLSDCSDAVSNTHTAKKGYRTGPAGHASFPGQWQQPQSCDGSHCVMSMKGASQNTAVPSASLYWLQQLSPEHLLRLRCWQSCIPIEK